MKKKYFYIFLFTMLTSSFFPISLRADLPTTATALSSGNYISKSASSSYGGWLIYNLESDKIVGYCVIKSEGYFEFLTTELISSISADNFVFNFRNTGASNGYAKIESGTYYLLIINEGTEEASITYSIDALDNEYPFIYCPENGYIFGAANNINLFIGLLIGIGIGIIPSIVLLIKKTKSKKTEKDKTIAKTKENANNKKVNIDRRLCSYCGQEIKEKAKYCEHCGAEQ